MEDNIRIYNKSELEDFNIVSNKKIKKFSNKNELVISSKGTLYLKKEFLSFLNYSTTDYVYIMYNNKTKELLICGEDSFGVDSFDNDINKQKEYTFKISKSSTSFYMNLKEVCSYLKINLPTTYTVTKGEIISKKIINFIILTPKN